MVLHTFHQLTILAANKEETGKRFVCVSSSHYLKHLVCSSHHLPFQFGTYLGIWKRRPRAVLALSSSFIHSLRRLLLAVGRHPCASVSQGKPGESGNCSLQRVYNLVEKMRHAVSTVNREEHFECCTVGRGQVPCECARRKNPALDGKGRRLKE